VNLVDDFFKIVAVGSAFYVSAWLKTQRRILLVVGVLVLAFAGLVALAELLLGAVLGSVMVFGAVVIMTAAYFGLARPWLLRWGATAGEVARPMPGDGILGADTAPAG
jgi:hypothetical protein